jgi:DNA-directed RNA polymerase specialized sigma24 family protein
MSEAAMALRPQLLLRARELTGQRADLDAEDLVASALLTMVAKPPAAATASKLHHWLRTVMRNQNARAFRDLRGAEILSVEAIQETYSRVIGSPG